MIGATGAGTGPGICRCSTTPRTSYAEFGCPSENALSGFRPSGGMAMAGGHARGSVREDMAGVRAAFEENFTDGAEVGACFCATLDGETVADLWGGYANGARTRAWERDTIVNVYSTTMTIAALTALLVADRGELDFDAP